ncbi:hypothetical protein QLS91_11765 [Flavobacterium sp. LB2P84]|uniref:ATP-binding protein n=1 Tax=Flavobacterium yafengii TaxID=3041253 RepID=A0AAW6TTF3_9FLAO|nr:hypothetical protein [Flavobacterium yafengii]MDI5950342.1 hypothetical protein [Flavobacterium yafengii]MDI6033751.1 hypothetical protein [Flavobacterium yafengii]
MTFNANAQSSKIIAGFNNIESVATDGHFIYLADIGKILYPSTKDNDGKIIRLDRKGEIIDSTFIKEKLNAPKGLTVTEKILFLTDIDRLIAIDLKTGNKLYEINFSKDTSYLRDISIQDKNTLYISASDTNKIFKVNLIDKTYSKIKTDKLILGINGLSYHKKSNRIYVNSFGNNTDANGSIGYINLIDNTFTKLAIVAGNYNGIYINNNILYTSNWFPFQKKGALLSFQLSNLRTNTIKAPKSLTGPSDFFILDDQIIVSDLINRKLHFIPL